MFAHLVVVVQFPHPTSVARPVAEILSHSEDFHSWHNRLDSTQSGIVEETRVQPRVLPSIQPWRVPWRETRFTLDEARRALPYVARVIDDATEAFVAVQQARAGLAARPGARQRIELGATRDAALRRLNAAIDECDAVGADLLNIRLGVVRFNAEIDCGPVSLLWRLGEPVSDAWLGLR